MRLVQHREIPEDPALRRQWNELVFRMERAQVFYTWEWAFAVQSAYRVSLKPLLLLAYEEDELVGVASLATDTGDRNVSFLAAATSDYCDFVSRPDVRSHLINVVVTKLREIGVKRVSLASIPADSSTVPVLARAARSKGFRAFRHTAQLCAQVVLGSGEQRVKLAQSFLGKKLLRRSLRAMEAGGPVTLRHLRSPAEIETNLPDFMRAHIARFLVTQRISNLTRPERRFFLGELGRLLSESGWLSLSTLNIGEHPVAWNYGFRFCGSWFWYQPTIDSRMEHSSPGYCLLSKIVAEACETDDLKVVDLGVGAEGYKERFANGTRPTLDFSLNRDLRPHARNVARYWAAKAVKISPRIESAFRQGLDVLDSVRARLRETGNGGFIEWGAKRLKNEISGRDEVFFYEWTGNAERRDPPGIEFKPLDLELLTESATRYFDDAETMNYLLRATQRLHREGGSGFALTAAGLGIVHYCWVRDFEGFYMDELKIKLAAPGKNAVMIFDCWTPSSARGHGYYGLAVSRLAERVCSEGKTPWIFSAAGNTSSSRGIEKSSFLRRYSMVRRKILFRQSVRKVQVPGSPVAEAVTRS